MSIVPSLGVVYAPSTQSSLPHLTVDQLKGLGINFIRICWVDWTNVTRCRIASLSFFLKLAKSDRPGITMAQVLLGQAYLASAPGFSASGEFVYVPDFSTLRLCSFAPGHASVLGWFQNKDLSPGLDNKLTLDCCLCPRTILRNVLEQASRLGVELLVGFENEFTLLKSTRPVEAVGTHLYASPTATYPGRVETKVLEEIANGIVEDGIELQVYHAEGAAGQYEIVTGPLPPLEAADALIHTRQIIHNIAAKHNIHATFAPRVFKDQPGSSTHFHLSLHSANNQKVPNQLSPLEEHFLASLLNHLPSITGITLPTTASYERMVDGIWSGGTYISWGTENRESPVRLTNLATPNTRRFELRFIDGTANPHLSLAAIISAGLAGVREKTKLVIKDCPGPPSAAEMSEEERQALGITKRMALTWEEARSNLDKSRLLRDNLGDEFITKFLLVNKLLVEQMNVYKDDESATLTRLVELF